VKVGLKVMSPPVEDDDRWDTENIITVSLIIVRFPFVKSLLYIVSFTEVNDKFMLHRNFVSYLFDSLYSWNRFESPTCV